MPDIDWQLESSVGERKITNSHFALLISSRFKTAFRDNLVLPNCESLSIPWMLAEKDDWVPQKFAPFTWVKQEAQDTCVPGVDLTSTHGDHKTKLTASGANPGSARGTDDKTEDVKDVIYVQMAPDDPALKPVSSQTQNDTSRSVSSGSAFHADTSSADSLLSFPASTSEELMVPLLRADGTRDSSNHSRADFSRASTLDEQPSVSSEDDKAKRVGRRARMMDLGKKMGEKLEEKRRHIEEKSRHIVEKMRENSKS